MENPFQTTSFIPKRPLATERAVEPRHSSVFSLLAMFFFIGSIISAGGVYFYNKSVGARIIVKKDQISHSEDAIDTKFLDEIKELDRRIKASNTILDNHIALSPIFQALSVITLKSIRYSHFDYKISNDSEKGKTVDISMDGTAQSYRSIALQSDKFSENRNIQDPVFSNLSLTDKGLINFNLSFSVNPDFLKYKGGEIFNN